MLAEEVEVLDGVAEVEPLVLVLVLVLEVLAVGQRPLQEHHPEQVPVLQDARVSQDDLHVARLLQRLVDRLLQVLVHADLHDLVLGHFPVVGLQGVQGQFLARRPDLDRRLVRDQFESRLIFRRVFLCKLQPLDFRH